MIRVIHVGLPKTATTYLQKEVFEGFTHILSCETLSGRTYRDRELFAYGIHAKYGSEIKVLVGLRSKDKLIRSLYNQSVKSGYNFHGFNYWYNYIFDKKLVDYVSYITLLNSLFKSVYVYNFEDFIKNPDDTVKHICKFLDIPEKKAVKKFYNKKLNKLELLIFRFFTFLREGYKFILGKGN